MSASNLGKITSFGQKMSKKKTDRLTHEGMSDQQFDKMCITLTKRVVQNAEIEANSKNKIFSFQQKDQFVKAFSSIPADQPLSPGISPCPSPTNLIRGARGGYTLKSKKDKHSNLLRIEES